MLPHKMPSSKKIKYDSILEFWEHLPESERIIVDVLRQIILKNLPASCEEKLTNNVPYYFGKKRICMIWPSSIQGGGIKRGVMLGFSYGNRLKDSGNYLTHGTNKRIFYKIYTSADDIDEHAIVALLKEAVEIDGK
jgi:hypothetical protein